MHIVSFWDFVKKLPSILILISSSLIDVTPGVKILLQDTRSLRWLTTVGIFVARATLRLLVGRRTAVEFSPLFFKIVEFRHTHTPLSQIWRILGF